MIAARRMPPVIVWAGIGALSLGLIFWVLVQWVEAGITVMSPGADPLPFWQLVLIRVLEWGQFAALLVLLWIFVVRPLRRGIGLGFDGFLVLAACALNFWDPLDNYLNFVFQYNAHYINVRSWGEFIPGWASGPDVWVVPIFFIFGAYTWAFWGAAYTTTAIVNGLGQRRFGMSLTLRFAVAFLVNATVVGISELIYLQTGSIANIGTPDTFTLWSDRYNGWPLYNPLFMGLAWTAVGWLRWSRDARGISAVERGVEQLPVSSSIQTLLRFLAIFAFLQVSYIILYFVPWNLFGMLGDSWPPTPSWFPLP